LAWRVSEAVRGTHRLAGWFRFGLALGMSRTGTRLAFAPARFAWHYTGRTRSKKGVNLDPGGLIAWLVVGLVAGWLAGQFMRGGGYGVVGDIVLGVIGAFVGGFIFSLVLPGSGVGLLGSIVVAFVGAVVLIALARAFTGRRVRA